MEELEENKKKNFKKLQNNWDDKKLYMKEEKENLFLDN